MAEDTALKPSEGARGPIAFVASDEVMYQMACAYVAMMRPTGSGMHVFRDMEEVSRSLTEYSKRCRQLSQIQPGERFTARSHGDDAARYSIEVLTLS